MSSLKKTWHVRVYSEIEHHLLSEWLNCKGMVDSE